MSNDTVEVLEKTDEILSKTTELIISALEKSSPTVQQGWEVMVGSMQILSIGSIIVSFLLFGVTAYFAVPLFKKAEWEENGNGYNVMFCIVAVIGFINTCVMLAMMKYWVLGSFLPEGRLLWKIMIAQGIIPG